MADGVPITPGSGATVATDDAGGAGQVQIVKLAVSADGSATVIGADANGLDVDPTRLPGTAADGAALPSVIHVIGGYDSSNVQALVTDASGFLQVDIDGGTVAHDASDSGKPVKVGARARTSHTAAVSNDDRSDLTTDKYGRLVITNAIPDTQVSGKVNVTNNTAAEVLAAPGANTRIVVTSILVTNAHATVGSKVEIIDDETSKLVGYAAAAGGGFQLVNRNGLFISTANKVVKAKAVTTGSDIDVFISGYKLPE